ncbi:SCP2 sterol-binding domain-containing protein, partial [Candidatus Bipolaricaulota bacterium]|nr:SCP2 sterol-binding domain-containing protein [Candidatus Bipolaricaulota bacterium]
KLAGMICCAAGPMLSVPGAKDDVRWYLDAVVQAGREVVKLDAISAETQAILDRSLAEKPGEYAEFVNTYWKSVSVTPDDTSKSAEQVATAEITPLAPSQGMSSVRDLVSHLPQSFSPDAAGDLSAVIQFEISDEEPGIYHLVIESGTCTAFEGAHPTPKMTIHSPAGVWMDICTGKQDGAAAYMFGKYRVSGDAMLLMQFGSLFKS